MSEFLHMGGYAFYVWFSFGAAAAIYAWNALAPRWQRRDITQRMTEDEP